METSRKIPPVMSNVSSGQVISNQSVPYNEQLNILNGGTAVGMMVEYGGDLVVQAGGTASNTTLSSGGNMTVAGIASGITAASGSHETIIRGGIATGDVVAGDALVKRGGMLNSATIAAGGVVNDNGTMNDTTVAGTFYMSAIAFHTTIAAGGVVETSRGSGNGVMHDTTVLSGGVLVAAANYPHSTSLLAAVSTHIHSGGVVLVDNAIASGVTVSRGGRLILTNTGGIGSATDVHVSSGGIVVLAGGALSDVTATAGADVISTGVVLDGPHTFLAAGTLSGHTIASGISEYVMQSGVAVSAVVSPDFDGALYGEQIVLAGGIASATTVDGGDQLIASGGTAIDDTLSAGYVTNYGTFDGGVAMSGILNDLGIISGTTITTVNGILEVGPSSTAVAEALTVSDGGEVYLDGATLDGATVTSGMIKAVADSGDNVVISNVTLQQRGILALGTLSTAAGTTVESGGKLILDVPGDVTGTILRNGGTIEFSQKDVSGTTATLTANALVISGGGSMEQLILAGSYGSATFAIHSAGTGTDVTLLTGGAPTQTGPLADEAGSAGIAAIRHDLLAGPVVAAAVSRSYAAAAPNHGGAVVEYAAMHDIMVWPHPT